MATARPFAFNTGSTVSGTTQIGDLGVGVDAIRYDLHPGDITWYMGADEELGYIVARPNPSFYRPKFLRAAFTEQGFLDMCNYASREQSGPVFTNTLDAKNWIASEGYWTTYPGGTAPLTELFRLDVTGTTVNFLRVAGTSLDAGDDPLWDFGDTTTADTINSTFSHTYTGGYVAPAEKTISFTTINPNDATLLYAYGGSPASPNSVVDIVLSGFTTLETLYVQNNPLSVLDLSNNSNLKYLAIGGTLLTSFDGTDTPGLLTLSVGPNTNLTSLDITNNPNLTSLTADGTGLSSIDVSNNTALTTLVIYNNSISTLDISNNTVLSNLYAYSTNLSTIDLSNNTSISTIVANLCNISSISFNTGSTYANFSQMNISDNNMTSQEINDLMDLMWNMRTKFTSGFISNNFAGNNADLTFLSTHNLLALQKDYGWTDFGADYNIPDGIMEFGWTSAGPSNNNVSNYFQTNYTNSPSKRAIYGNTITSASGYTDLTIDVYAETNLSNFQSSNVQWYLRLEYKLDFGDSYTILDTTTYSFTGNTSGMELQKTINQTIGGIIGSDGFVLTYEIILTDNRADKSEVGGDLMTLRVVPTLNSPNQEAGVVIYPYGTQVQNFYRTKWGA